MSNLPKLRDELGDKRMLCGILIHAQRTYTTAEYNEFVARLQNKHLFTQSDIKAALMVNDGTLDSRLFFCGVANSKILTLDDISQQRLLSREKFRLRMQDGSIDCKTWADMTIKERNQLLGPKGGRIRSVDEQRH